MPQARFGVEVRPTIEAPPSPRYKVRFRDTETLTAASAIESAATEVRVVNRKWGFLGVQMPPRLRAVTEAGRAFDWQLNVLVCFSAGNYHDLAGGAPDQCHPSSIWLHKSRGDLMTVATSKLDDSMWYYSSRGPGQRFGQANTRHKPDVTAPTPENGRVVYGGNIVTLAEGWGTSGASPQAAGLAALLVARNKSLTRDQVFDAIRAACHPLGHGHDCEGEGLIDCASAVGSV